MDDKHNNIKIMIKDLGSLYNKIKDKQLKGDYQRLLYFVQSDKADFKKILLYINKKIKVSDEDFASFWKKVRDIILNTYIKNI
jgi:hypothetical protein